MQKKSKLTGASVKIKESDSDDSQIFTFHGATTLPDRTKEKLDDGTVIEGEILDKKVLDKIADKINDKNRLGGANGSYRTISLFHNRVYEKNPTLEEAGYVKPNARVVEMPEFPGHFALDVDIEVNKKFSPPSNYPDYDSDKIIYKLDKDALGLSIEYNNTSEQEKIIDVEGKKYRYVMDSDDFRGFGFARANVTGNPTAVRVKEITAVINKINKMGENNMVDENEDMAKIKELETQLETSNSKIKELEDKKKEAEEKKDDEKVKELSGKLEEASAKIKETESAVSKLKLSNDEFASKIKESFDVALSNLEVAQPTMQSEDGTDAKIKEMSSILDAKAKEIDWASYADLAEAKYKEQAEYLVNQLKGPGINIEEHQTLKVKCQGRTMVIVPTTKTKEMLSVKTKDTLDSGSMAEGTYNQTNAMFADRYVPGITETFLKSDNLLKTMLKIPHISGNDKYQWKIWIDFVTVSGDNTLAVDPNTTSVQRTKRKFEKLESRIVEYRDGVEVTDFTQFHSVAAVGDLLGIEINRAAEAVNESMAADLFKGKVDDTSGWLGFVGLLGVADSTTHSSIYGKTRTAANRLLDGTLANTYVTTSEAISVAIVRDGYEKVLAQGSNIGEIAIVTTPIQSRLLFNSQDTNIRHSPLTMNAAPASFGFNRVMVPHIDGIPIIRDYHAVDASGNADTFAVVDLGSKGYVLVVSKTLGARGLAKVGTSEAMYVNFWGAAIYKRPRNVFLHDGLNLS